MDNLFAIGRRLMKGNDIRQTNARVDDGKLLDIKVENITTGMINSAMVVSDGCLLVCGRARQQGQVLTFDKQTRRPKFLALSPSTICQVALLPKTNGIISALATGEIVIIENGQATLLKHSVLSRSSNSHTHQFVVTDHFAFSAFSENVILLYKWKKRQPCFRPFIPHLFAVEARDHETAYTLSEGGERLTLFSLKILKPLKTLYNSLPPMKSKNNRSVAVRYDSLHCIPRTNFIAAIWYDPSNNPSISIFYKSLSHTCFTAKLPSDDVNGRPLFMLTMADKLCVVYKAYFCCRIYRIESRSAEDCSLEYWATARHTDMPKYRPKVVGAIETDGSLWISRADGVVAKIDISERVAMMGERVKM